MKKLIPLLLVLTFEPAFTQEPLHDKEFFTNSLISGSHFYSSATYTIPGWVKNINQRLPVNEKYFFTPGNSLELNYVSSHGGTWKAEILYHPVRGIDFFKPATQLVFRLFVQSTSKPDELPLIAIGNRRNKSYSSYLPLNDFIEVYEINRWLTVEIPFQKFAGLASIAVNDIDVIAFQQQSENGKEHKMFIDQIELLPEEVYQPVTKAPNIISAKGYEKHVDISWEKVSDNNVKYVKIYRSTDNKKFYPVAVESPLFSRFSDYTDTTYCKFYYKISFLNGDYKESPFSNMVSASTFPMNDEQLLDMIQEACFRYYWEGSESNSGLSLECIPGRRNMIAAGASGFGIMALIAGGERNFVARKQLTDRFDIITRFLEKADKFHGAFPHFMDGPTGKIEPFFGQRDNGGDLVETSFLLQGLLTAREYFNSNNEKEKNIRERITKIWEGIEWDWYTKESGSKFLYWHWSPDKAWLINHKLIGWNETMITYILGISSPTHSIPASMYYSGWASQGEEAQKYRSAWGKTQDGSHYTNGNVYYGIPLKVGVSNGGPLFFVHYSFLGLDPHQMKDSYTDYFSNNRNIALINYRYCVENPEKNVGYGGAAWGLTASDGPWRYAADEPNERGDNGKMTPTGALASFPYTPEESMKALKNYYRNYGKFLWGAYGFRDSFNLDENWCSEIFMGLNQAPIDVMIENYRTGLLWKLFMQSPDIQSGLKRLSAEKPN
jgi:hypothetical protein